MMVLLNCHPWMVLSIKANWTNLTEESWIKDPFTLDDNDVFIAGFFCRHVWTVIILVTMQPISDDIKIYADNMKSPFWYRQVQTAPRKNSIDSIPQNSFVNQHVTILYYFVHCQYVRYNICKDIDFTTGTKKILFARTSNMFTDTTKILHAINSGKAIQILRDIGIQPGTIKNFITRNVTYKAWLSLYIFN